MRVPLESLRWSPIPDSLPEAEMTEDEEGLTRIMTDLYYMTSFQVAELMAWKEAQTRYHLSLLERAGWIQGVYVTWRGKRWRVYAPSPHVGTLLAATDPDWAITHEAWQAPSDMQVKGQAIPHALDRNLFCQAALGNAYHWQWPAWWEYQSFKVRVPGSDVGSIVPDAVLHVRQHVWYVEIERSWRLSTLTSKLVRYAEVYQRHAWGRYQRVVPRLLIVANTTSSQQVALDTWLSHLDHMARQWVVLLPWEELQGTWQCWVWSPMGERTQVGWRDLNSMPVSRTPDGSPRMTVKRRRPVSSDTPWLD